MFKITNKINGEDIRSHSGYDADSLTFQYSFNFQPVSCMVLPLSWSFPGDWSLYKNGKLAQVYLMANSDGVDNYGIMDCSVSSEGTIFFNAIDVNNMLATDSSFFMFVAADSEGNYDIDYFYCKFLKPCFVKDTLITLSDYSTKFVQDISYDDEILVWNFDDGRYDTAKPLWIKKTQISSYYYNVVLDNGTTLKLVGSNGKCHRLFSVDDGMFISATDMVGKTTFTQNGNAKVISCDIVEESVEFYNIITNYHMNLFANGVLTSCRYNNIYPIENMKFIKNDLGISNDVCKLFDNNPELKKYVYGLRLNEQTNISIEDTIRYCQRLESLRLK